jgi:hypothetical protein
VEPWVSCLMARMVAVFVMLAASPPPPSVTMA